MDIFATFATDAVAESEGRWFPLSKTAKVKVARTGNPNYLKALRQRMSDAQVDFEDTSEATEALVTKLIDETLAETVLLGWEGITEKGVAVPYSRLKAEQYLGVKDFKKRITKIADDYKSFSLKQEAEQGND